MKYIVCEWSLQNCPSFHNIIFDEINMAINLASEIGSARCSIYELKDISFVSNQGVLLESKKFKQ